MEKWYDAEIWTSSKISLLYLYVVYKGVCILICVKKRGGRRDAQCCTHLKEGTQFKTISRRKTNKVYLEDATDFVHTPNGQNDLCSIFFKQMHLAYTNI